MGGKLRVFTVKMAMIAVMALIITYFCIVDEVHASAPKSCYDKNRIDVIYVRGSGENYNGTFYQAISPSLKNNINETRFSIKELTPDLVHASAEPYVATSVTKGIDGRYSSIAAVLSQGQFGKYKSSVDSGKILLKTFLNELSEQQNECVVLLGYSQGAQVIGDTLMDIASEYPGLLDRIIYVGLFGDPKLDLRGEGFSLGRDIPWYRGDAIPVINGGSLGSRIPYVPKFNDVYMGPIGSWCYEDDFICTENYMTTPSISAHGKYPERAFGQMSLEVANAINSSLNLNEGGQLLGLTCNLTKQDIVILLDTSPLMRRDAKLFTDTPMYDPFHVSPQGAKLPPRTAGQMLTSAGCGDTKIAVVGYGRPADGAPRLLLDFTSDPGAYDSLMKSLYEPSSSGIYDRTQFREGILEALNVNWREGANRAIYALTDIAGSGPDWGGGTSGHTDSLKQDRYKKDITTQQIVSEARSKRTLIWGLPVRHSYTGYVPATPTSGGDARSYLNMFTEHTGGYNWNKEWINYGEYNFKFTRLQDTVNEALQRQEKMAATTTPLQGIRGQSVTVKLIDTVSALADAKLRNESISYRWYVDCDDKTKRVSTSTAELTFTPASSQRCTGAVIVYTRNMTGNGCYSGCPEPFPPYSVRSFPFAIDIKPADYVPKTPAVITDIHKTIYDDRVEYAWNEPALNGSDSAVYVIRELDGHVLAVTTLRQLTIEQTEGGDPIIQIETAGTDGASMPTLSSDIPTIDMRTVDLPEVIDLPYFESKNPVEQPTEPLKTGTPIIAPDTTIQSDDKEQDSTGTGRDIYTGDHNGSVLQPASILSRTLGYSIENTSSAALGSEKSSIPAAGAAMDQLGTGRAAQQQGSTIALQRGDVLLGVVIAGVLGGALWFRKTLKH